MLRFREADLPRIGAVIADMLMAGDAVGLSGDLGAGKTSLARAILLALGYTQDVPSPSFSIVQAYAPPELRLPVWHVDLYRLTSSDDVAELGLTDARTDHALLIEWPERIAPPWPDMLTVQIAGVGADRSLTATVPPAWESRWTLTAL